MKILFFKNRSIYNAEITYSLSLTGNDLEIVDIPDTNEEIIEGFSGELAVRIATAINTFRPDILFGVEFYPAISDFALTFSLPYYSWILSMKLEELYSRAARNNCNRIFIPDRRIVEKLKNESVGTIEYMAYGVPDGSLVNTEEIKKEFEISFIGSLYPEIQNDEYERAMKKDSTIGYVDGMVESQRQTRIELFEKLLPRYVLDDLTSACPMHIDANNSIDMRTYYTYRFFYDRVSRRERMLTINTIGQTGVIDVYTDDAEFDNPERFINHGVIPYESIDEILKRSLISLNVSSRKYKSGITPLAWKILASGALLVTDLHEEYNEYFEKDKDLIMAEDVLDMANKVLLIRMYPGDLVRIANSGHKKAVENNKLSMRLNKMLESC